MVDITSASPDEIVADAARVTKMVCENENVSSATLTELVKWLCAYTMRMGKDLNEIPHKSQADIQKEIQCWADRIN